MLPGIPEIVKQESTYENNDALKLEIIAFLDAIQNDTPVIVSGEAGRRALDTAIQITSLLKDS
jgi:predicted dehydrogenase